MEHILHLVARAFVETACAAPSGHCCGGAATVEDEDEDECDGWPDDDGVDPGDITDFEASHVHSKVPGLIDQVCFLLPT